MDVLMTSFQKFSDQLLHRKPNGRVPKIATTFFSGTAKDASGWMNRKWYINNLSKVYQRRILSIKMKTNFLFSQQEL